MLSRWRRRCTKSAILPERIALWGFLLGVLCMPLALAQSRPASPPRFMELWVAGVNLLRDGAETLKRKFGRAETRVSATGRVYRYRDARGGVLLEVVIDEESGSIKRARAARMLVLPTAPPAAFRLPTPLTGAGLSLGDTSATVERRLGRPHRVERKDGRMDYLYRAPMREDGLWPAYRAQYTFVNGRLDQLVIALGENG